MRLRMLLLIPGVMFLAAIVAFEFGVRMGREKALREMRGERESGAELEREADEEVPVDRLGEEGLIGLLLEQGIDERRFSFPEVVKASSGRRLVAVAGSEASAVIVDAIESAADEVLLLFNAAESPTRGLRRINEASRFFEDALRATLDRHEALSCTIPRTAGGGEQRAGYPDLRIEHHPSGTVAYLDPKLFEETSRESSLRSFYFTPKGESSKIGDDGHHLILGISHDGTDGAWTFTGWELVDLARLRVRLKAEFQASNRDLYREEVILRRSRRDRRN